MVLRPQQGSLLLMQVWPSAAAEQKGLGFPTDGIQPGLATKSASPLATAKKDLGFLDLVAC